MSEVLKNNQEFNNQAHPLEDVPSFEEHMKTVQVSENGIYMGEDKGEYDFATPDELQNISERTEQMDFNDLNAVHARLVGTVEAADLFRTELDGEYRNCYLEKDGDEFRIVVPVDSHIFNRIDNRDVSFIPPTPNEPLDYPNPPLDLEHIPEPDQPDGQIPPKNWG